jgi:hypothetical protein
MRICDLLHRLAAAGIPVTRTQYFYHVSRNRIPAPQVDAVGLRSVSETDFDRVLDFFRTWESRTCPSLADRRSALVTSGGPS